MNCCTTVTFAKENTDSGLFACFSGRERCTPGHSFGPAVRDHYIIHYILRGRGVLEHSGTSCTLGPSDGFLITPFHAVSYTADSHDPWEYAWFAFRGTEADALLARCGLSTDSPVFHYRLSEPLEQHIPPEYRRPAAAVSRDYEALGELYRFLSLLMRNEESRQGAVNTGGQSLRQAMAFIEANYFREFTVEELAAHVGLSRSALYRVFKNTLGLSVQSYILQYRLGKARYLVCHTALSIAEIALSCGFTDQSYFTRCFRSRYGEAPLAYRAGDEARPLQR